MKLSCTKDYIFYTIQGEGRFMGVPSVFLRLSGCNLRCEWLNTKGGTNLCDTPYSSHFPEKEIKVVDEVIQDIESYNCEHLVITGGEPFLQKNLVDLTEQLVGLGKYITIETNATIYLPTKAQFISMSPKLSSSCVSSSEHFKKHQDLRFQENVILRFIENHDFQLKFVINNDEDLSEVEEIITNLESKTNIPIRNKVYLMPQAISKEEIEEKSQWLIEECKSRNYNFCDRLHIRIWNKKRGV